MNNEILNGTKDIEGKSLWYYMLVKLSQRSGVSSCFFDDAECMYGDGRQLRITRYGTRLSTWKDMDGCSLKDSQNVSIVFNDTLRDDTNVYTGDDSEMFMVRQYEYNLCKMSGHEDIDKVLEAVDAFVAGGDFNDPFEDTPKKATVLFLFSSGSNSVSGSSQADEMFSKHTGVFEMYSEGGADECMSIADKMLEGLNIGTPDEHYAILSKADDICSGMRKVAKSRHEALCSKVSSGLGLPYEVQRCESYKNSDLIRYIKLSDFADIMMCQPEYVIDEERMNDESENFLFATHEWFYLEERLRALCKRSLSFGITHNADKSHWFIRFRGKLCCEIKVSNLRDVEFIFSENGSCRKMFVFGECLSKTFIEKVIEKVERVGWSNNFQRSVVDFRYATSVCE